MVDFLDLDKLVPAPREIKLGGKRWKISGEISVKDTLKLLDLWQRFGTSPDSPDEIREIFSHLTIFFKEHHPEVTTDKLVEMIKFSQLTNLVMFLFNSMVQADEKLEDLLDTDKNDPEGKEPEKKAEEGAVQVTPGQ